MGKIYDLGQKQIELYISFPQKGKNRHKAVFSSYSEVNLMTAP